MIHLKQAIIVEGKYDKIRLSQFIDATIIVTNGFRVFKNDELISLINTLAQKNGVIIMTDSDFSGFKIRNYLKDRIKCDNIINVYMPEVLGKERRKASPSKEGLIGVEGFNEKDIISALRRAGIFGEKPTDNARKITPYDLYNLGLTGKPDCKEKRKKFEKSLSVPSHISNNALLDLLNSIFTYDEFIKYLIDNNF